MQRCPAVGIQVGWVLGAGGSLRHAPGTFIHFCDTLSPYYHFIIAGAWLLVGQNAISLAWHYSIACKKPFQPFGLFSAGCSPPCVRVFRSKRERKGKQKGSKREKGSSQKNHLNSLKYIEGRRSATRKAELVGVRISVYDLNVFK